MQITGLVEYALLLLKCANRIRDRKTRRNGPGRAGNYKFRQDINIHWETGYDLIS